MIGPELVCLSLIVFWEARSEPLAGQVAVAQVVLARVLSPSFAGTVCEVMIEPAQFSFYWDGIPETVYEEEAWLKAQLVASAVAAGSGHAEFEGVTHYHADYVNPDWPRLELVTTIGKHLFYRRKA